MASLTSRRNVLKSFALTTLVATTVAASPSGAQTPSTQPSTPSLLDVVKKRGYVNIGLRKDFPPFGYIDQKGDWVGYEIDLARYIAKKLGVELREVEVVTKTKMALLMNENIDVLMAASNPTRERSKVVDFTQPYFVDGQALLVRKDGDVKGLADLAGRKVGTVQGSLDGPNLLAKQPKAELVAYQEYPQAVLALKNGRVDAVTTSLSVLSLYTRQDPSLAVITPTFKPDPFVLIVRPNDSRWRLALEEVIMDAATDGTLASIQEKFVGGGPTTQVHLWRDYY